MNRVMLTGRIATELELKKTPSDVSVCSFRLAVNRRFKNAEGKYDADFISCVAWRQQADFISKFFSKGEPIEIGGTLQTRSYQKDDQTVYITEVVVDDVGFTLLKKSESPSDNAIVASNTNAIPDGFEPVYDEEDLPF